MPSQILMPALSPTMEEGKLAKWLVKEGDQVSSGDVIAEIETDKATMEVEAVDEGVLAKILIAEGTDNVKVNSVIALILEEGEDSSALDNMASPAAAPATAVNDSAAASNEQDTNEAAVPAPTNIQILSDADDIDDPEIPEGTEMVTQTVREALRDAMAEEMRADNTVFVMGEEVAQYQGAYKVTQGLLDEFGDKRVIDTPITECGFTGVGVGAAFGGLRPIVEFMTFNFAMLAIDHIINSAAKTLYMSGGQMRCPIVFRGPNGAASRVAAQHSQNFASWYANIPGLKVVSPHSAADAKGLLKAAIRDPNPVVFLENEIMYGKSFEVPKLDDFTIEIGKARKVRNGKDVTLVGYSFAMEYINQALPELIELGLDPEIIDLRSIRPIDVSTIVKSLQKTNRLVVVDEGWPACGIGAEISALMMEHGFDYMDAPIKRVSGKDVPMPYAANLEKLALPSAKDVIDAVKSVCYI